MYKKDVPLPLVPRPCFWSPHLGPPPFRWVAPLCALRWVALVPFRWVAVVPPVLFLLSWRLLCLFVVLLFPLCLLFLGRLLWSSLASAGVRPLVPSLSGSWVLPLLCGVALVGRLVSPCRLWLRPSVRLALRVFLFPSVCVLAGLLLAGSVPLRLLRLALLPLKLLPLVGWPFGVALRWVAVAVLVAAGSLLPAPWPRELPWLAALWASLPLTSSS